MLYLLDTNILLAYMRRGLLEAYLEATYGLSAISPVPIISIVTEAEIRVLADENGWGAFKRRMLQTMLDYVRVLPIPFAANVDAYVAIEAYSRQRGVTMGKNDIWIAATAHVTGAHLLTMDHDFDHLGGVFFQRDWIDPASHL